MRSCAPSEVMPEMFNVFVKMQTEMEGQASPEGLF